VVLRMGVFRALVGRFRSINQKIIKKIFGLSSIFSLGWLIISLRRKLWLFFLRGYGLILYFFVKIINALNLYKAQDASQSLEFSQILAFVILLLIISGVPPFIIFFIKVIIIFYIIKIRLIISIVLLMVSLYLMYIYLIIVFYILTLHKSTPLVVFNRIKTVRFFELLIYNLLYSVIFIYSC
jgi:NADH:ubiquinone oxidoreductase subunit 2 (subunit N)